MLLNLKLLHINSRCILLLLTHSRVYTSSYQGGGESFNSKNTLTNIQFLFSRTIMPILNKLLRRSLTIGLMLGHNDYMYNVLFVVACWSDDCIAQACLLLMNCWSDEHCGPHGLLTYYTCINSVEQKWCKSRICTYEIHFSCLSHDKSFKWFRSNYVRYKCSAETYACSSKEYLNPHD